MTKMLKRINTLYNIATAAKVSEHCIGARQTHTPGSIICLREMTIWPRPWNYDVSRFLFRPTWRTFLPIFFTVRFKTTKPWGFADIGPRRK